MTAKNGYQKNRNPIPKTPNGNYRVSYCRDTFSVFSLCNSDLFTGPRNFGRRNILFYLEKERIDSPRDTVYQLALSMATSPNLEVVLVTTETPAYSTNADVVMMGFDSPSEAFYKQIRETMEERGDYKNLYDLRKRVKAEVPGKTLEAAA